MLRESLLKLMNRQDLSGEELRSSIQELMQTQNPVQIGAFISLLSSKPINNEEFSALLSVLQSQMIPVKVDEDVLDIAGTGGDGLNTLNISTAGAILAAASGARVVKHGNRAVSSECGSADVLAELGISMDLTPLQVVTMLNQAGFSFCFAPRFNPMMVTLQGFRRQLSVPTVFNLLGPLLNPAQPKALIMGVSDPQKIPQIAYFLAKSKVNRGLVVHCRGSDEICTLGVTQGYLIDHSEIRDFRLDPRDFGFRICGIDELKGGTPSENAKRIFEVFSGIPSAFSDSVALTAATALYLDRRVRSIEEGLTLVRMQIGNGSALRLLQQFRSRQEQAA